MKTKSTIVKTMHPVRMSLLMFLLAGGAFCASAESEAIKKAYDVSANGSLSVENVNGKITVTTWDGNAVKMAAVKSANSQEGLDGIKVIVKSTVNSLEITTTLPRKKGWFGRGKNYGAKVDYVLQVPSTIRIRKAASVNGNVTIAGVQGGVRASTVNGGISSSGLNGSVELSTVNGLVKCETFTSSPKYSIEISTVNGGVELALPATINARLKVNTVNGSIKSELAFSDTKVSRRREVRATIGKGGVAVGLSTVNGGIRIRKINGLGARAGRS